VSRTKAADLSTSSIIHILPMSAKRSGGISMKSFVSIIVALGLAVAFTAPAFAADPPATKADCEKAKMKWDDTAKKCS
jgi:hypothetical protein